MAKGVGEATRRTLSNPAQVGEDKCRMSAYLSYLFQGMLPQKLFLLALFNLLPRIVSSVSSTCQPVEGQSSHTTCLNSLLTTEAVVVTQLAISNPSTSVTGSFSIVFEIVQSIG